MATVLRRVLENSPEPALGDVPIRSALRNVPKCRHRVCLRRPRAAASLRILAGSDPSAWRRWLDLLDVRGSWLVWDGGIPRLPAASAPRCVASLLACCAGKRFAFPQLRTLSGSNPMRWAQTKTVPLRGPFPIQWWAMRDSNPQPCACKAPALTVAPIARAERV